MPDVDSALFRQLCGHFATGIVVITAIGPDGLPAGMTANSFTSVSLDPPLISVNVDRGAEFRPVLVAAERFVVNVLGSSQEEISRRFASPSPRRFEGIGHRRLPGGDVALDGAIAVIRCERFATFDVGDHTIVVGRVVGGEARDGRPLLYFRGGYHPLI